MDAAQETNHPVVKIHPSCFTVPYLERR